MNFPRPNVDIFRNARQNFLRRQQASEDADLERQQSRAQQERIEQLSDLYEPHRPHDGTPAPVRAVQEMAERPSPASTILRRFAAFQRPSFNFMPSQAPRHPASQVPPRPSSSRYSSSEIESPKTPLFNFLPARSRRASPARATTEVSSLYDGRPTMSGARGGDEITEPAPAMAAEMLHGRSRDRRRFGGVDPAELHLAGMAEEGRQRRERRHRHQHRHRHHHRRHRSDGSHRHRSRRSEDSEQRRSRRRRSPPKHFLFCFPWIKSRTMRNQILRCFVSGIFLALILTIYLALSLTKNMNSSEFTLLFILFILFATAIFCHGLIRLCILVVKPPPPVEEGTEGDRADLRQMYGFSIPSQAIPVILARDEEAIGIENSEPKAEPPAYGKWRESVRVDPNRIFWQRNDDSSSPVPSPPNGDQERPVTSGSRRPPSYASDDGISYVLEAQPRSTAPSTDVPLPSHPSEAGRVGRFPG